MIKNLYEKSEIWFAVAWIIAYVVLASTGDNISADIGILKIVTLPILIILSVILFLFVKRNGLSEKYGLCKSEIPASKMLFYIPLVILLTANLWYGVTMNVSLLESVLYILSMLFVGFLEEMIFRGFLFNAMAIGFAFVMIYYKTKSLVPCILTYSIFNSLSTFANEAVMTPQKQIIAGVLITIIAGGYALYITLLVKEKNTKQ